MKKILFTIISLFILFISCEDDCNCDTEINNNTTNTELQQYKFLFENNNDLSEWSILNQEGGMYEIVSESLEGNGSLKLSSGCLILERQEGLLIKKNTNYSVKTTYRAVEESSDGSFCYMNIPDFGYKIAQGENYRHWNYLTLTSEWNKNTEYFYSDSTATPIQLQLAIQVGYTLWIDEIVIEEVEKLNK